MNNINQEKNMIYFEGPKTNEDFNGPNIHDIDPYDIIRRSILSIHEDKTKEEKERKLPDSIKIKNSKSIEFRLNSTDPYDIGQKLYRSSIVTLKYGLNVLVGPNGSGKSTILRMLRDDLNYSNYKFYSYDNLHDGGSNSVAKAGFYGDFAHMAGILCGSEGEGIMENINKVAQAIGKFIRREKENHPNEPIFILLDSIDSGLSANNIKLLKDLFDLIHNDCKDAVIVTSCNTYEMTKAAYCWDVKNSRKITFKSYEEYYNFICESSKEE